ncbi:MAG: LysR family transcriptional regulator [Acetivibrionales bacterium]|jgi:DNA-binding transcriptional LysR family regulator|nr:LysR family transcriptional regulator [Bacillota bacterium]NLP07843.1 LysR family transcriptional regulator [Clostridiaceae bacterium]HOA55416.1 LysR family transcriptional regulator [Clostridiales bacterium]HQD30925.1 LysR family transcriptional regulator [Clostridiales bacterium]
MAPKLDLYRVFCEVAKCRSFSRAARELYMTQPAVSQAVMNLERELGVRLFTRTSKGVTLTNDGHLLFEHVNSAINLIHLGENKLLGSRDLKTGEMKVGVGDTISKYFLLPYLEIFRSQYPNVKLNIINRTTTELCALVKSGEIDIAVCNFPIKEDGLETRECIEIHDIFVCGGKYISRFQKPARLEEIADMPLILLERKSNSRLYVEKYMLSQGIRVTPEIELGSHDLLLEFASFNFGVACVVEEFSQEYLRTSRLFRIELAHEIPPRSIGFCYLKSVPLSPAAQKLVEVVSDEQRPG